MNNIFDSEIISSRARAEAAARIAEQALGINQAYVSLQVDTPPAPYVEGSGVPYGSMLTAAGLIQPLKWITDDGEWQAHGALVPTKAYVDSMSGGADVTQQIDEAIGTAASSLTETIDKKQNLRTISEFGAIGTGDDTEAITGAAQSGQAVWFPNGTYVVSAEVELTDGTRFLGESKEGVTFSAPGTHPFVFRISGEGESDPIAVAGDVEKGEYSIPVPDGSLFAKDQIIRIASDLSLGFVDTQGESKERFVGELLKVKRVLGNIIRTYQPVYFRYYTDENAVIYPCAMKKDVSLKNFGIVRDREAAIQAGASTYGVYSQYTESLAIENVSCKSIEYTAYNVEYCYNGIIDKCQTYDIAYDSRVTQKTQYGVEIGSSSRNITVRDCYFEDCRHAVSIGGQQVVMDINILDSLLIGSQVENGEGAHAADSHFGANVRYSGCTIMGGATVGPLSVQFYDCDIYSASFSYCVGIRGYSNNEEFPRELYIDRCRLHYRGGSSLTDRGPIYTPVADSVQTFKLVVNKCTIHYLKRSNYFVLGAHDVEFTNNDVTYHIGTERFIPTSASDYNNGIDLNSAIKAKITGNNIEGYISHNNPNKAIDSFIIADNTLYNTTGDALTVIADESQKEGKLNVNNNIIINPYKSGIRIGGLDQVTINNNILDASVVNQSADPMRGVDVDGDCNSIKVSDNDFICRDAGYYASNQNVSHEDITDNDFRDLDGGYSARYLPSATGATDLFRKGNKGWLGEVIYNKASYSTLSEYIAGIVPAGATKNLQITFYRNQFRLSAELHVLIDRAVTEGDGSRQSASQLWHLNALNSAGSLRDTAIAKISGVGLPAEDSDYLFGTPVVGSADTILNIPISNDDTFDVRVNIVGSFISYFSNIAAISIT